MARGRSPGQVVVRIGLLEAALGPYSTLIAHLTTTARSFPELGEAKTHEPPPFPTIHPPEPQPWPEASRAGIARPRDSESGLWV